jgi:hypothetical protein
MSHSLDTITAALRKRLDHHEQFERGEVPRSVPPPPVELTPERVAEIAQVIRKSHPILSLLGMHGVTPSEVAALCERAKGAR